MKTRRAVFFDRDGVLVEATVRNGTPFQPAGLRDIEFVQGARDSVARLRDAGFVAICVTNQPDVARGSLDVTLAAAMNKYVLESLGLDDLIACFHDDRDACTCRKPQPGMLFQGAARWSVVLGESFMVGDRWRDIDAGAAAGCRTVLVDRGWAEREPESKPDASVSSVIAAAAWILSEARERVR